MSEPWKLVHITRDSKDSTVIDALERAGFLDDLWVVLNSEGNLLVTEAEARLIAAAPKMLQVLKEIAEAAGDSPGYIDIVAVGSEDVREVIAKAETGTNPSSASVFDSSHTLVTVPDCSSRTCSGCGRSEFDAGISDPCPSPTPPVSEAPGTDETPDPPDPDIEDELEEEATNHANETGHGIDGGS